MKALIRFPFSVAASAFAVNSLAMGDTFFRVAGNMPVVPYPCQIVLV